MRRKPLVSIITVNYNGEAETCALLESLRNCTYPYLEVIVVDNASPAGVPERVLYEYPEATLILAARNLGFAGGNNLGLQSASGEYVLFLNNDTEVPAGFLEPLVAAAQAKPWAGMLSPKITYHHTPGMVQYAGCNALNPITMRCVPVGKGEWDNPAFSKAGTTHFAHGAAMLVPRTVIEQVGKMDDSYFLYYEEIDWAMRIKAAGYSIEYVPQSQVFHKESIATGRNSPLKTYYLTRNRALLARKHLTGAMRVASLAYLSLIVLPRDLVRNLFKPAQLAASCKAFWWHMSHRVTSTTLNYKNTPSHATRSIFA